MIHGGREFVWSRNGAISHWRGSNKWTLIHGREEFVWGRNGGIHGLVRNKKRLIQINKASFWNFSKVAERHFCD